MISSVDWMTRCNFLPNYLGGPQERARRAACGPRAAGWPGLCYRKQARYLYYRPPYMHRAHFTPCLHGVYIVHTLPARVLREVVNMSSAFPRPTISAANGCAIIAAFPLNRLHNRMRPIDADRVYTSTGQVALTILLQNGDPMLIVELTRLLLQWL